MMNKGVGNPYLFLKSTSSHLGLRVDEALAVILQIPLITSQTGSPVDISGSPMCLSGPQCALWSCTGSPIRRTGNPVSLQF